MAAGAGDAARVQAVTRTIHLKFLLIGLVGFYFVLRLVVFSTTSSFLHPVTLF
jgi:hypothetical protein